MVYEQENIGKFKFRRVFNENVDSEELVWHRDREDRKIFVESSNGWMLQMDNELPQVLQEGQSYIIPKLTYHRVIKGTGDLKIVIDEGFNKIKVPKAVQNEVKKGLFYMKKRTSHPLLETYVTLKDVEDLKKYFHTNKTKVLKEEHKGKPHNDPDYIDWLLHGGNKGEEWILKISK
jgi:hypothetical protein